MSFEIKRSPLIRTPPTGAGMVLVNKKNQVLLVQGAETGKWSFPKGRLEKGESAIQAALREFQEETGLNLKHTPHRILASRNTGSDKYYRYYGIMLQNEDDAVFEIIRPFEILAIEWKSLAEVDELKFEANYHVRVMRKFIADVMNAYNLFSSHSCHVDRAPFPMQRFPLSLQKAF